MSRPIDRRKFLVPALVIGRLVAFGGGSQPIGDEGETSAIRGDVVSQIRSQITGNAR